MNGMCRAVLLLCLMIAGCQTVKTEPLQDFGGAPLAKSAAADVEGCMASVARLSEEATLTLFQTKKMTRGFSVFRLVLKATGETDVQFSRNMMTLSSGEKELAPVDPARVAYETRAKRVKGLYLLGGIGIVAELGATANRKKTNDTMEMWIRREAVPAEGIIKAGTSLAGFLYFERSIGTGEKRAGEDRNGELSLSLSIRTGDKEQVITLRNIPKVDVILEDGGSEP